MGNTGVGMAAYVKDFIQHSSIKIVQGDRSKKKFPGVSLKNNPR